MGLLSQLCHMEQLPKFIPPTGGDYFVLALDRLMRRTDLEGNLCRLVLRLDGPLDRERFRSTLQHSSLMTWLSGVHLTRRFPFYSRRWFTSDPSAGIDIREHSSHEPTGGDDLLPGGVPPLAGDHQSNRPLGLSFDLVDHPDRSTSLILTWHHALMDARGAELLLEHINQGSAVDQENGKLVSLVGPTSLKPLVKYCVTFPGMFLAARKAVLFITRTSRAPIASLSTSPGNGAGRRNRHHYIPFSEQETAGIDSHGDRIGATFHKGLFYLAATIQALDRVLKQRGEGDGAYVTPVPQDLRKRKARGPIFSNRITFQFYRIEPEQAGSLEETFASLKRQMIGQLRDGIPHCYLTMMELFRDVPLRLYSRILRGPTKDQISTLFYSFTGEICGGMESFLGSRVRAIGHLAPVANPPGVAVIFSRHRDRLCATLSCVEGCFRPEDYVLFEQTIRSALVEGDRL